MKVKELLCFLCERFPVQLACDFDNVGLLVGNENQEISGVLVALDCTKFAIEKAKENGINLIVTHHPVIFNPLKQVLENDLVYTLIKNDISVISMHTNLDTADGGVNDVLAEVLELRNVKKLVCEDGFTIRQGELPRVMSANDFAKHISQKLKTNVKYCGENQIKTVTVCSGNGGEFFPLAIEKGADAFVTAECKHHLFLLAQEKAVFLADAGHFNTEDIIVEPLASLIKETNLKVITYHYSPIKEYNL